MNAFEIFLIGLVIGVLAGGLVMFFFYRNNSTKINNISNVMKSNLGAADKVKKLTEIL